MPKRTPDQGVQPFERRPGSEEIPFFRGMNRSADPASIPPNQFHLLVNTRIQPADLQERPGLATEIDTESGTCVTGMIETQENTGGGGPLRGIVSLFPPGLTKDGATRWLHLGPVVREPYSPANISSLGLDLIPYDINTAQMFWRFWPGNGTRFFYQGPSSGCGGGLPACVIYGLAQGPFPLFKFQGNTCALGAIGSSTSPYPSLGETIAIFALTGSDNDSAGALNAIAFLGTIGVAPNIVPTSCAVREEIIGGEIKDVLYIGAYDRVMRFDGVTLTEWFVSPNATPYSVHVFAQGQEILILENASTYLSADAAIYYQPAPGEAITSSVLPASLFVDAANPTYTWGGWTGACKFRDTWVVTFEGGQNQGRNPPPRTPFSGVVTATADSPTLTFAQVYQSGPGVALDGNVYYHIGSPIVWQDQIVFMASQTMRRDSNGNDSWGPDSGTAVIPATGINTIGNWTDANGWQIPAVAGPGFYSGSSFGDWNLNYYGSGQMSWHMTVGNTYVMSFNSYSDFVGELIWGQPWPNGSVLIPRAVGAFTEPTPPCATGAFFAEDEAEEG